MSLRYYPTPENEARMDAAMARHAAGQVVPTLAETSGDFIGPLNPHVGRWVFAATIPHNREALTLTAFIVCAVALIVGSIILP